MFFFSLGMFFWIILTAILFNRIIFHGMLAQKFLPTLAIFIAPPAVAMLGYLNINGGEFDLFAQFLLNIALTFALLLFVLAKNFYKITFSSRGGLLLFPLLHSLSHFLLHTKKHNIPPLSYLAFSHLCLQALLSHLWGLKLLARYCVEIFAKKNRFN